MARFVLMDRAVSDVRDGLKPVQRRILWAMHQLKATADKGFKKSAKVVGDTMGGYHPHGGEAIYGTLVTMVGARYPLIEGQGNFGGPTDSPASMRYTEARLTPLSNLLMEDIAVGEFVPNYSGDLKEPLVLPSRLPLLLLNGSSGIGVGIRAVIPPHNLRELTKILVYVLKKDNPSLKTALKHLKGPDYGYGVLLSSKEDIFSLYSTGSGTLRFRCEYEYETAKNGTHVLLVKGLAPGFNMAGFLRKMRDLQEQGLIEYCSDDTRAEGVRIYIGFKDSGVIKERVLPEIYTTQSYQFYVVKRNGESSLTEETLFSGGLLQLLKEFVDFRREVEGSRLSLALRMERAKLHRVKAVLAALAHLDVVYDVLRSPHKDLASMRESLSSSLSITDKQAGLILDMKVHRLARMNASIQKQEQATIRKTMKEIKNDLDNIDDVILRSLKEVVKLSDARGTRVVEVDDAPSLPKCSLEKYVIIQGTKATRLDRAPSRRHKFDLLGVDSSSILFVYRDNSVTTFSLSYSVAEALPSLPVGVISGSSSILCALDDRGLLSTIKVPSKVSFNVMRGATALLSAVGATEDTTLVVLSSSGLCRTIPPSKIKGSRAFSLGKKPFPSNSRWKSQDPCALYAVDSGTKLYSSRGRCVAPRLGEEYMSKSISFDSKNDPLFTIGDENFVLVAKEDKRDIVDRKSAVMLLKEGNLRSCWPLHSS